MKILNCTNHIATYKQKELGVIEPKNKELIRKMINFDKVEDIFGCKLRADYILKEVIANDCEIAMIGGAPFFMTYLENYLLLHGIYVAYAFSKRISKEIILSNGEVKKISLFDSDTIIIKKINGEIEILKNKK